MKKNILNIAGLYTKEQFEGLEERCKELWKMLNSAHACLEVRSIAIDTATEENANISYENRMAEIRAHAAKLQEMAGRIETVMHENNEYTFW